MQQQWRSSSSPSPSSSLRVLSFVPFSWWTNSHFSLSQTHSRSAKLLSFREALLNGSLFVGDSSYFFPRNSPLLIEEKLTVQLCLITFLVHCAVLLASISPTFCPPFFVQRFNFTNICAKIVLRKLDYKFCAVCHILALFCQMLSAQWEKLWKSYNQNVGEMKPRWLLVLYM